MFKRCSTVLGLVLIGLSSVSTAASGAGGLLWRTTSTGFVEPGKMLRVECEIHPHYVLITRSFGAVQSVEEKKIRFVSIARLVDAIKEASKGDFENLHPPVDGPSASYGAQMRGAGGTETEVLLLRANGGTGRGLINKSDAAVRLRNLIDQHCGE